MSGPCGHVCIRWGCSRWKLLCSGNLQVQTSPSVRCSAGASRPSCAAGGRGRGEFNQRYSALTMPRRWRRSWRRRVCPKIFRSQEATAYGEITGGHGDHRRPRRSQEATEITGGHGDHRRPRRSQEATAYGDERLACCVGIPRSIACGCRSRISGGAVEGE